MGKGGSRRASRKKQSKVQKLPIKKKVEGAEEIEIRSESGVPLRPNERLGAKVTEKEHLTVKLLQARNTIIDKQKQIHERQRKIEELELLVAQKDNAIFMLENGLKDGSNLRQSKDDGQWYWVENGHKVSAKPEDDGEKAEGKSDDDEPESDDGASEDSDDSTDETDDESDDESDDGDEADEDSDEEESAEVTEPNPEAAPTA